MKTTIVLIKLSLLLLVAPSLAAQEQRHPLLENDFSVSLGALVNSKDVKLSLNGTGPGDNIDFDRIWSLGDSETGVAGQFRWNFGEKWSLAGQYFGSDDSAKAVLDEDIHWGDLTLEAGSNIRAGVQVDVSRLVIGRTVSESAKHDFELGFGLHWLELGAYLAGEAIINGESTGYAKESASAGAPLPNVSATYQYAFTPKWLLRASVDWFSASFDEYSGSLWNAAIGAEYQVLTNFGVSLAYQFFKLDVDVDGGNWDGSVGLSYQGPFISLVATW